jgi:YVTN family beta-propeller protein
VLAIRDDDGLRILDSEPTGKGLNHPHGQWITADGEFMVVPNVFKGEGVAGSISIMDLDRLEVVRELTSPAILMPVAAGIKGSSKAYVANIVSGQVTVIDLGTREIVKNIPVTLTPDCRSGAQFNIFDPAGSHPDAGQPGRSLRRRGGAVAHHRGPRLHRLARPRDHHRHGDGHRSRPRRDITA